MEENIRTVVEEIKTLQTQLMKRIDETKSDVTSLRELHKKTESENKMNKDPIVDAELKKMTERLNKMEDDYKNQALKLESEKKYKTVDGLAEHISFEERVGRKKIDRYKLAKSILEDPHGDDYKKAFFSYVKSAHSVERSEALRKMGEVVSEIKNSSHDTEESFIKKNLTTIIGEQAGYLAPPELDLDIQKMLFETSPLRQVASVKTTIRGVYEFIVRTSLPGAYWGNSQLGVKKTEEQKYQMGKIAVQDLQAEPAIPHNLIEDSVVNIESELREDLEEQFMLTENKAFILGQGEGSAEPQGLKWYADRSGTVPNVEKPLELERMDEAVADFDADTLLNLSAKLFSQYKKNAVWLINRATKNTIRQFKTTTGQYLFSTGQGWGGFQGVPQIMDGMNGRIDGYPILECDDLEGVGADQYPIYFGDFSKYCIVDRLGLTLIRDEVTEKGFILFWFRKRMGAGFKMCQGVKVLKTT